MSHKSYNKAAEGIIVNALAGNEELKQFWKGNIIQQLQKESQQIVRHC